MFSPIQPARYIRCIDVSISKFQKTCLCKFSACVMFLDVSCTILWRCKLKSPQNGNLKKSIIHLSRNIIHMTYMTFIFHSKCEGQKQFLYEWTIWFNKYKGQLLCIEMNRLKREMWSEMWSEVHKGTLCVTFSLFNTQGLWIVFPHCLAGTKTSEEL